MSIKIQIISDLHIEFWKKIDALKHIKPTGDILALLGDTCCLADNANFNKFKIFIKQISDYYKKIIIITGNHEYYSYSNIIKYENTLQGVNEKLKKFSSENTKVVFLNNEGYLLELNNVKYFIIGSTCWTFIPEATYNLILNTMNDYKFINLYSKSGKIQKLHPKYTNMLHRLSVKKINNLLKYSNKHKYKTIIFTHHKPYLSKKHNPLTTDVAYENNLKHMFGKNIFLWGYGHTHMYDKSVINGTYLYSNPHGYPKEQTYYQWDKSLKI